MDEHCAAQRVRRRSGCALRGGCVIGRNDGRPEHGALRWRCAGVHWRGSGGGRASSTFTIALSVLALVFARLTKKCVSFCTPEKGSRERQRQMDAARVASTKHDRESKRAGQDGYAPLMETITRSLFAQPCTLPLFIIWPAIH